MGSAQIGARIREIRMQRGITAAFLARKLGFKSPSSYTRIEKGQSPVTFEKASEIADILGVDVNEFRHGQKMRETRKSETSA